jgi:uronate dehydrogenase
MAQVLVPQLRERYGPLALLSRRPVEDPDPADRHHLADLSDLEGVVEAAEGVDAILHLGGIADESAFDAILQSNIVGAYNLYEAARVQGVRRVLFASSNHVTGFYPATEVIGTDAPPRPDTLYGASKVYGEALGRLYHDKFGLEVVALRIGSYRAEPDDVRQLSTWLSHRDGLELICRSLEAPGVGYLTIYGVSANTRSYWRLGPEADALGWAPVDDAERFAEALGAPPPGSPTADEDEDEDDVRQGGTYVNPQYTGGYW